MLFYQPRACSTRSASTYPPHKYGEQVHDARRHRRSTGTTTRSARSRKILTVDKNGKDATQAGFDPTNIVQWGFEPQRDDLRGLGAYWGAGTLAAADGKTVQIPDAWKAAWKFWLRRHVDGPHRA